MADTKIGKSVKFSEGELESDDSNAADSSDELDRQFNKFQLLDLVEGQETVGSEDDGSDIGQDRDEDQSLNQQATSNTNSRKSRRNKRRNKGKLSKKKIDNLTKDGQIPTSSIIDNRRSEPNELQNNININPYLRLLKLNMKHLIPENELKKMFGRSVLKEEKTKESKAIRHHHLMGSSGNQRSRFSSSAVFDSKIALIGSGPRMEFDELLNQQLKDKTFREDKSSKRQSSVASANNVNNDAPIYFKFVHEKSYQTAHNMFLDAAQQGYSDGVIQNLSVFPAHVESLIQLSDMFKVAEDYKAASDMIERALLIFERGFHQKFNLSLGNCRLSYRRPENRSFFITIFKHIMYTNRKGLRRTPLEYSKLLLSLDPENDPLFATLLIDFYAIRSEEYDYLIEFISECKHLSKLPNMNFSLALAFFFKSRNLKRRKEDDENTLKVADEYLQQSLIRFPNFIIPLLDACSAEPNSELKKCDYFNYSLYTNKYKTAPESVDLLVSIYVQRTLMIWKTKDVLAWLERNIAILVDRFSTKELVDQGQQIEYWSSFRGPSPRNLLRHIVLSDLKVKVPPSASGSTILDIDPYPPESIISYARDNSSTATNETGNSNTSSFGFSSLFLRSILPNFNLSDNGSTDINPPNR